MCAEEGVRQGYNPFVSAVSVATAVMKNKNWINKTYFFLSRVAIRHRLLNLPPVYAPRNARYWQSAQLCLNRGPLPVTPGGLQYHSHMGVVAPKEWRRDSEAQQKRGDRPEKCFRPQQRELMLSTDVCHSAWARLRVICLQNLRNFREIRQQMHTLPESAWLIYTCSAGLSSDDEDLSQWKYE